MRKPTPVDALVGKRLRDRRLALGFGSREVARLIGVSHHQLEKYERGLSRVTSGPLSKMSNLLGVSPSFLFGNATSRQASGNEGSREASELGAFLLTEEGQELNRAFHRIREKRIRRLYLALVCAVASL